MRFSIAAIAAAIMATAMALPTPDAENPAGMSSIWIWDDPSDIMCGGLCFLDKRKRLPDR